MDTLSTIAGAQFRSKEDKDSLDLCVVGDKLRLERDANNEYDLNAIRLILLDEDTEHFVGFVARKDNLHVAAAMDQGEEYEAEIIALRDKRQHEIKIYPTGKVGKPLENNRYVTPPENEHPNMPFLDDLDDDIPF